MVNTNKEVWQAFNAVSDVQTLLFDFDSHGVVPINGEVARELRHAKQHLYEVVRSWSVDEMQKTVISSVQDTDCNFGEE